MQCGGGSGDDGRSGHGASSAAWGQQRQWEPRGERRGAAGACMSSSRASEGSATWTRESTLAAGSRRQPHLRAALLGRSAGAAPGAGNSGGGGGGGGSPVPIFLGYRCTMLACDALKGMLRSQRIPLIFDLDETLLYARSLSQLREDVRQFDRRR